MKQITYILVAVIFACGVAMAGYFVQNGLVQIQSADRYVTVKGLAEQDVMADLAVWPIQFKVANNDLKSAQTELKRQSDIIRKFLVENGIKLDEITVQKITVNDAQAQQYQANNITTRYAINQKMVARTNNVAAIINAAQNVGDLVNQGVLIGYGAMPQYSFTQLNDIKPGMIANATLNARQAAEQFAKDSGAKVGAIRSAKQGYFSINARDNIGNVPASASPHKTVRVVSTVEYYIHD